jgi:serine/threonine protein kinase
MSKCKQCGNELDAGVRYCPNCATKVETPPQPAAAANPATKTISGNETEYFPVEQVSSSADLEPGKDFHGRYTIERKLGQGAMGVVYLAGDKLTKRNVALKLINPALINSTSARERFLREGLIARDIRHKHVVAVYDVSETEGQYYLTMEFLSGETLRNWLHRTLQAGQDVPYDSAEKIIRNILEGLDAAHTSGVIHRDVKPENIMLTGKAETGDFSLKILDFGIARAIDSSGKQVVTTTTSTGTALYMAPEQKTAADTVGPPADLYAVTAIFYELLLGVAPTGRWTPLSKDREDLPVGIDAVIDKGLSSRPRSRYQNAQEYLKAINEIRNAPSGTGSLNTFTEKKETVTKTQTSFVPPPGPQIISRKGRLGTESLVWTNAPAEELQQSVWQVLQAFGVKGLQSDSQNRTVQGATGWNWRSYGQKISAVIEGVSGGSTVNITGQGKSFAVADLGRGREDIQKMSGMLIQKLAAAGRKAQVAREVHSSPPTWIVILAVVGWLIIIGAFMQFGYDNF